MPRPPGRAGIQGPFLLMNQAEADCRSGKKLRGDSYMVRTEPDARLHLVLLEQ